MKLRVALSAVVIALASCGGTGAARGPPAVVDEWLLPVGLDADPDTIYQENRHLFDYDAEAPLDLEQAGIRRIDGVTVVDLSYASPKGGRVPATLFVPDGSGAFAGLVLMHGLPSDRSAMSQPATAFARLGAVVITIDAPFARPHNAGREALLLTENDRDEQIQLIVDLRRAVDVLISRTDVDPDRLAYVGVSYGGAMGGLLAGVEDRLAAYALQLGDGGLVTHLTGPEDQGDYLYTGLSEEARQAWLEAMWPIEPIHYVSHAAPAALLFQNGATDELVPPADALRYQAAGSEPKTTLWYDEGHGISPAAVNDALAWLQDVGGLNQLQATTPALSIDRALLIWLVLTIGSLGYLSWALWEDQTTQWGSIGVWLLVVVFFGPLGLLAYVNLYRRPTRAADGAEAAMSASKRALGSTMWSAAGNLVGVFVIALSNSYEPALVVLLPLGTGLLVYWLSRFPRREGSRWTTHAQPLTVQIVSTNTILIGAYVLLPSALDRFDLWYPFGEPIRAIWAVLVLGSAAAVLTGYPAHRWMVSRGLIRWGPATGDVESQTRRLSRLQSLGLMLASFAILVAIVQVAMALAATGQTPSL